jgi:branched-chain amino acid transport system substrate-binding protein
MTFKHLGWATAPLIAAAIVLIAVAGCEKKQSTPGVTDTEIKIGTTQPFSGPASSYATFGRSASAYFDKINAEEGGVNGRKITYIMYDDGYTPPKTVEQIRRLVEQDGVLMTFFTLGTPTNSAIWEYMNQKQVPHLFVATGASKWGDPEGHPWSMGWQPDYATEAAIYAKYILDNIPDAKIGILYQNDDYGKDYLHGFKAGLGDKAGSLIIEEQSYEVSDATIESQIVALRDSGANVFFNITIPKFAAQAIRKADEIGWKPTQFLNNVSSSIEAVLKPVGLDKAQGIISSLFLKDPNDPQWAETQEVQDYVAFMAKYNPDQNVKDLFNVYGYSAAQTLVHVLKACGDDLSRENVMKQAASIDGLALRLLLPGIQLHTSATDFYPMQSMQLAKFEGDRWVRFGDVLAAESE